MVTVHDKRIDLLVGGVAARSPRALLDLFELLGPQILDAARDRLADVAACEAVQRATFIEVWRLARFHPSTGGSAREWIHAIAARRLADRNGVDRSAWQAAVDLWDQQHRLELDQIFAAAT